jgi:hypothetical protein
VTTADAEPTQTKIVKKPRPSWRDLHDYSLGKSYACYLCSAYTQYHAGIRSGS